MEVKEVKSVQEMFGPLWGQYWISPGIEVYHRHDIGSDGRSVPNACPMIVDFVDKRTIKKDERIPKTSIPVPEKKAFRINGIMCHWYVAGQYSKGLFFTKELIPKSIVDKDQVQDWLKRFEP